MTSSTSSEEPRPGSVRFLSSTTDEGTIRAFITRNGGEQVDVAKLVGYKP